MGILIAVILVYAWLIYEMHTAPFQDDRYDSEEEEYESDEDAMF